MLAALNATEILANTKTKECGVRFASVMSRVESICGVCEILKKMPLSCGLTDLLQTVKVFVKVAPAAQRQTPAHSLSFMGNV